MVVRYLSFAFAGIFSLAAVFGLDEEEYHYTYDGFELPEEVTMPASEVHPSLWFGAGDLAKIVEKRNVDSVAAGYWAALQDSEFLLAELPAVPSLDDGTKEIHKYYGTLTQIAAYNAFLYQAGDDEKKSAYLAKAVEALLRGYSGPLYQLDPIVKGSAVDEIYQGVWAQNFAAAYDWVQPALSKAQDEAIRSHLVEHARYMYENLWSWASSPHNHLSKPAWGLGSVALCLSDHPEAKAWLERAVAASNANTRYFFSKDGIYREGSHYYLFSFINFVPFLYHYRNTSGYDAFVPFQPAFEWPILTRNGKGWMWNFEDSFIRPYPSQLVAGAYRSASTRLHSRAPLAEVLQWNFQATDYTAFDKSEAKTGYNYTGATWDYTKALMEYLCYEPEIGVAAPDVSPVQFLDSGQSVFRSDWSFNDPQSRTLVFHAVAEADNHAHYDHLSFTLQAENQMMSSDAGYTRSSYGEAMRKDWYLTAEAHNVVLANGKAPGDRAENLAPYSSSRLVSPFFSCEIKEAPYEDGGTHRRLIAMLEGDRYAIMDQVSLPMAGDIGIVMHGGRATLSSLEDLHEWKYQDDDYGPAAGLRQWFWGKGFKTQELSGELTYIKGDFAAFPYLKHFKVGDSGLGLTLLDPVAAEEAGREYVYERKSDTVVVVRNANGNEWISANPTGSYVGESIWKTDANFSYFNTLAGGETQAAGVEVSSLKLGKNIELQLNAPATLAFQVDAEQRSMELYYSSPEAVQGLVRFSGKLYRLDLVGSGKMTLE